MSSRQTRSEGILPSVACVHHQITSVRKTQPISISPRSALKPPSAPFAPSSIKWPSGSSTPTTSIVTGTSCAVKFIAHLKESGLQTVTINAYLCAMKGVAQTAWNLGQVSDHDLMRIKAIKQVRGSRKMAGKALTRQESKAMLSKCEGTTPQVIRDRAILLLLLGCGLRRAEITRIELKNVFLDEARIRLVGKGNKERDIFMNDVVLDAVAQWLAVRKQVITDWNVKYPYKTGNAGDGTIGFLFGKWTRHYSYLIVDRPLNPWTIGDIVKKYKSEAEEMAAGLKTVTTHDLRRTFATRLLEKDVDITTVKNLMGHSSISTTTLYDRRGDDAMKRAAKVVDL